MESIILEVTQGKYPDVKAVRAAKRVPMVYYGKGVKNANFSVDYQEFRRAFEKGGKSTIIKLVDEDKKEFPVLVHELQYHPVTGDILHVDLKAVDMTKPIQTQVPIKFVGVSLAVKDDGGIFIKSKESVEVKCLPQNLVHELEVDISPIADFNTVLTVENIVVPEGIEILDALDVNLASVAAPRDIEAEEAAMKAEDETLAAEAEAKEAGEGEEGEAAEGEEGEAAEGEEKAEAKEGEEKAEAKEGEGDKKEGGK